MVLLPNLLLNVFASFLAANFTIVWPRRGIAQVPRLNRFAWITSLRTIVLVVSVIPALSHRYASLSWNLAVLNNLRNRLIWIKSAGTTLTVSWIAYPSGAFSLLSYTYPSEVLQEPLVTFSWLLGSISVYYFIPLVLVVRKVVTVCLTTRLWYTARITSSISTWVV